MKATYSGTTHFMNEHARSLFKSYQADILDVREDEQRLNVEVDVEVNNEDHADHISTEFEMIPGSESNYGGWV